MFCFLVSYYTFSLGQSAMLFSAEPSTNLLGIKTRVVFYTYIVPAIFSNLILLGPLIDYTINLFSSFKLFLYVSFVYASMRENTWQQLIS